MKDENKTKKQLINELIELRQSISKLVRKKDEFKRLKKILPKTEELYHLFVENFQGIAFMGKIDFTPIFFKGAVEEITGYTEEEFLKGEPRWNQVIYPEDIARISKSLEAIRLKPRYHTEREYRIVRKDGQIRWIYELIQNICDSSGNPILVQGTLYDISERRRAEEALRESEDEYRSLVESTDDSIYLVDRNYRYLFINKKHISRLGFLGNEYLYKAYSEFHSPDETKWFIEKADKVFNTEESVRYEYKSLRDGRYFLQTFSPVKKADGKIVAVTVISKDITDYKIMEEKLHSLSLTDELTGLYNRRGFFTLAEQVLKLSNRQKKGIFLLYADVDNLKEINDTFGHKEGDLALIEIADILKKSYRDSDVAARIGGDEFVVIPIGTIGDNIKIITSRLQKAIEIHNSKGNRKYKLSVSIGQTYYDPKHPCSIDELLVQGDKSMYEKKKSKGQ